MTTIAPCAGDRGPRHHAEPDCGPSRRLADLAAGEAGRVLYIEGEPALRARLLALGLVPGTPVELISNHGGSVIAAVRSGRLALGRAMARRIQVQLEPEGRRPL